MIRNLDFKNAILRLDQMGLTDVILPFILIFTIIYAISSSVLHIGKNAENKKLKLVLSLVISLLVVIPHVTGTYPRGMDVIQIINNSIPQVAMLIVGVMLALMLMGALGIKGIIWGKKGKSIVWIAFGIVAMIFWDNISYGGIGRIPFLWWFSDGDVQAILIILIVFGLIVKFVIGDDQDNSNPPNDNDGFIKEIINTYNQQHNKKE